MNDDAFEKKLRELTSALQRPDPTPAWKADILARARREADAIPFQRTLPPRWFVAALGVAWVAIFVMKFTTPSEAPLIGLRDVAVAKRISAPGVLPQGESWALLAFHNRMNLNLDLPQ